MEHLQYVLKSGGWFQEPGAYVLSDGQFGSTGKGVVATMIAEVGLHADYVTSNAGPNSGHTGYFDGEKIVLRQLPMYGVVRHKMRPDFADTIMYLNGGAIIDPEVLVEEIRAHDIHKGKVWLSPFAAVVHPNDKILEQGIRDRIGSTGKGTGAALAQKIARDPEAVISMNTSGYDPFHVGSLVLDPNKVTFVEVSQGYSLGIDAGFYPYCTSRNCTVGAALSDAGIHPEYLRQSIMCVRTFPIRVGGNSGPGYPDQEEISWDVLGVEPEITTVTKKVRRVFTWSQIQFISALKANRPDYVFLNFLNYLPREKVDEFVEENILKPYRAVMNKPLRGVFLGFGPKTKDVAIWR